ncbi:MAG: hypothetical protein Q9201_007506, partial [Fulgogasparrea decipioides]
REELEKKLVRSLGEGIEMKVRREENGEGETQEDGEGRPEDEQHEDEGRQDEVRRGLRGKKTTPARRTSGRRGRSALVGEEADADNGEEEEAEEEDNQ